MRLNTYLTEVSGQQYNTQKMSASDASDWLMKECKQIIGEYKTSKNVLYRGVKGYKRDSFLITKEMRGDRTPRDTPHLQHDFLNKQFEKRFGWKVRNGVSTTSDWATAAGYGDDSAYVFFPQNGYKYVFSPEINDLWLTLPHQFQRQLSPEEIERWNDSGMLADIFDTYQNTGLELGMATRVEIMFNVPKYYLLAIHSGSTVRKVMKNIFNNIQIQNMMRY